MTITFRDPSQFSAISIFTVSYLPYYKSRMEKITNQSDCSHLVEPGLAEQGHAISLDSAFLLRDAIRDLNRIALVNNDNYNEMLLSPSSSAKCSETDGLFEAQEKLAVSEEAMLHDPEQLETGHLLGGLARAIYGFHSYIHALKDASDRHASEHRRQAIEIVRLQRQVEELQTQNNKIRKYVRHVVNDNITLADKLNQASRDKKKLFRHAKNLTAEIHSSKKYHEELQVLAHEHILIMASCSRERKGTADTEACTVCTNDDGTEHTLEAHGDFSLISSLHPSQKVLRILANEAEPLFIRDERTVDALQSPSLSESLGSDVYPSPSINAVALQTDSQDESLNDAGLNANHRPEILIAEHPLIENISETASRHPKKLLQSLGFSRKLPAESGITKNSSIFRENISRANEGTTSRSDGGLATVLVSSSSSFSIEAPEKSTRQDEQINASKYLNATLAEAEIHESTPELGCERGGNKPKATYPFWNRCPHNFAKALK